MNEGDKVRVVGNSNPRHHISIGEVCTVVKTVWHFRGYGDIQIKFEGLVQSVCLADVEIVTSHGTLQVGETYTNINGDNWECIAVKGDIAWLVGCYNGDACGAAYRFKTDGSPICLAIGGDKYRIKLPTTIKQQRYDVIVDGVAVAINYKTVDGVPDFTDATVVPF